MQWKKSPIDLTCGHYTSVVFVYLISVVPGSVDQLLDAVHLDLDFTHGVWSRPTLIVSV